MRIDGEAFLEVPSARVFHREKSSQSGSHTVGFGLQWEMPSDQQHRLLDSLRTLAHEPSQDARVEYVIAEQRATLDVIRDLEKAKTAQYRFLFLLIASYLAFLSAPYKLFPDITTEAAAFYAAGGFWASIVLVFVSDRFLRFLGTVTKRKIFLYRAISGNRDWVFASDSSYYVRSMFPAGITYDATRAWTWAPDELGANREMYAEDVPYNPFTTVLLFFVESLFVLGAVHFISILMRAWWGAGLDIFVENERLNMFSFDYFSRAFTTFLVLVIAWIDVSANECAHFQQGIWEARRMTPERPNPKFSGLAMKLRHRRVYRTAKLAHRILYFYAGLGLFFLIPEAWALQNPILDHMRSPGMAVTVAGAFLFVKILYGMERIQMESHADKEGRRRLSDVAAGS